MDQSGKLITIAEGDDKEIEKANIQTNLSYIRTSVDYIKVNNYAHDYPSYKNIQLCIIVNEYIEKRMFISTLKEA